MPESIMPLRAPKIDPARKAKAAGKIDRNLNKKSQKNKKKK
jgi:hypothetical protein